jgi:general secretion pathway protein M
MSGPVGAGAKAAAASVAPPAWKARRQRLTARWIAMAPRERAGIAAAGVTLGALLFWSLAIGPAWRTLQDTPAQLDRLGEQLQTMQRLAAESAELRNTPPVSTAQAGAALQSANDRLGSRVQMVLQGDRATVTVKQLSSDDLRNWLAEVRSAARARATEVQLARDAQGYSGTVVLSLGGGR